MDMKRERRKVYLRCFALLLGLWLALIILSMMLKISVLPTVVLLVVWGTMQVTYTLECIRLGKHSESL